MKGLTIMELIISVAVLALIMALSIIPFSKFSRAQSVAAAASAIAEALRDARARTLASVSASQYGVKIDDNQFTLFKGSSFSSTTPGNETFTFPYPVVASSSVSIVVFTRVTGNSSSSGTIDLFLPASPEFARKSVSIQSTGLVGIQ